MQLFLVISGEQGFLELDRNPLGDPGAAALAAGVASCDALTRLSLTHCEIGSSGAAAIASALPRTLVELDLSGNGIDAIGMGHVAGAVRELKVPKLALLNVSGNEIGPNSNYANLPAVSKWILSTGMILGRLEIFAILVIFLPSFWRN